MKKYIPLLGFFSFFFGCQSNTPLKMALQVAGDNRVELEKVLDQYKDNELKYKAATFLIENMPYYYYQEGDWMDTYYKYFEYYATRQYSFQEVIDKVRQEDGEMVSKSWINKKDIETVDSAYLANNIEWAFKVWQEQPWGKNITLDRFCEEILPYRIENEQLIPWRENLYNKYNSVLDEFRSSPDAENHFMAARIIIDTLASEGAIFTAQFPAGPHVGPKCVEWRAGTCREFSAVVIYTLRALGIPCGTDYFILHENVNHGHYWTYIRDMEENYYICDFPDTNIRPATYINMGKSKVYRKTFSLNREMSKNMGDKKMDIWPQFRYPLFKDVTSLYPDTILWNPEIPVNHLFKNPNKRQIVYLCEAVYTNWTAVDWCYPTNGLVKFTNVQGGTVFCLGVWNSATQEMEIISDPFHLDRHSGDIRFLNSDGEPQDITLYMKFIKTEVFLRRMLGGVFEGSHTPDFKEKDTLFVINESPYRLYTTVYPKQERKYRYIRYYGPEHGYCNISMFALYENMTDSLCLEGKPLVASGFSIQGESSDYMNAFDQNPYTSVDFKENYGGWVGLDLGQPKKIDKIVYAPRNCDNLIRTGDQYGLFYFSKGKWEELGRFVATADSLNFTAPTGALLYLKNYTRGRDERIFEYKEGKQIFW